MSEPKTRTAKLSLAQKDNLTESSSDRLTQNRELNEIVGCNTLGIFVTQQQVHRASSWKQPSSWELKPIPLGGDVVAHTARLPILLHPAS